MPVDRRLMASCNSPERLSFLSKLISIWPNCRTGNTSPAVVHRPGDWRLDLKEWMINQFAFNFFLGAFYCAHKRGHTHTRYHSVGSCTHSVGDDSVESKSRDRSLIGLLYSSQSRSSSRACSASKSKSKLHVGLRWFTCACSCGIETDIMATARKRRKRKCLRSITLYYCRYACVWSWQFVLSSVAATVTRSRKSIVLTKVDNYVQFYCMVKLIPI